MIKLSQKNNIVSEGDIMPSNIQNGNNRLYRERVNTSDENTLLFIKNIARVYNEMGLLSDAQKTQVDGMDNVTAANRIIGKVKEMSREQTLEFSDRFIGNDLTNFNGATPAILAEAYRAVFAKAKTDETQKQRLQKIAQHIDNMSADCANTGGLVVNSTVVDTTNIADVYPGFVDMIHARMGDLEKEKDEKKIADKRAEMAGLGVGLNDSNVNQMNKNLEMLGEIIDEYDDMWGLKNISSKNAFRLEKRWKSITDALAHAELSEETKKLISKYRFLDAQGNVIPQFKSRNRANRIEAINYAKRHKIIKDGRLASVIELARHDVAKRHVGRIDEKIDADALEAELNTEIVLKLYNMAVADKLVTDAISNPETFVATENPDEIVQSLSVNGGEISNDSYLAMLRSQTNATGGWADRIKAKSGSAGDYLGDGFFDRVFDSIDRVDDMANLRLTKVQVDANKTRAELFKGILKGFASAFIASAIITTIATAAAATAGISVAASLAMVGFIIALGRGIAQVHRWRKQQEKEGRLTADSTPREVINALLRDKQLITSLGVSAIAVIAICFGAAGMADAAMALGYGALALGGAKNMFDAYHKAQDANMSVVESLAWAIATAGAIAAGGVTGRAAAQAGTGWVNEHFQNNRIFQRVEHTTEQHEVTKEVEHSKMVTDYPEEAVPRAETAIKNWYADNPELLQQRIDAIESYNAEHGTDINPYRALRVMSLAGSDPNHLSYTDEWAVQHGYTPEQINAMANIFEPGSAVMNNPEGMELVQHFDLTRLDAQGHIGGVDGHVLQPRDVYSDLGDMPTQHTETWTETETHTETVDTTTRTPVDAGGMAMFGTITLRDRLKRLRRRVGAHLDTLKEGKLKHNQTVLQPVLESEPEQHTEPELTQKPENISEPEPVIETVSEPEPTSELKPDQLPVLEPVFEPELEPEPVQEPVIKPEVVTKKPIVWLNRSQYKSWQDMNERLKTVRERRKANPSPSKAAELRAQEEDLNRRINYLRNQLGHATIEEIELGVEKAKDRELLDLYRAQLKNLIARKPDSARQSIIDDWKRRKAALESQIKEKEDSLMKCEFYYPNPVKGVQAQKQEEREAQRVASINVGEILKKRDEAKEERARQFRIAERKVPDATLPNTFDSVLERAHQKTIIQTVDSEYIVPKSLQILAENKDVANQKVGKYHDFPVKFVDITHSENPIGNNDGTPIVAVDIAGIRLLFALSTGMNPDIPAAPGCWYPVSRISNKDGKFNMSFHVQDRHAKLQDALLEIADLLNTKVGDVRNWKDKKLTQEYRSHGGDGFIGGCNVIPQTDFTNVFKALVNSVYHWDDSFYDNYSCYSTMPGDTQEASRYDDLVSRALLDEVQGPNWKKGRLLNLLRRPRGRDDEPQGVLRGLLSNIKQKLNNSRKG